MLKRTSQPLVFCFALTDLALTGLAWLGAYWLRFESGWLAVTKDQPDAALCWRSLPLVLTLAALSYRLAGCYEVHRLRRFREELVAVCQGVALLSLLVMAARFFMQDPYESRATLVMFSVLTGLGVLLARRLAWSALQTVRRHGYNQSLAVIVGTGRVARRTARALRNASGMGIRTLGFVEDQPSHWSADLNLLGTTTDLPRLIEKYGVGHVFIALPMNRYAEARRVFDVLSQSLVEVRLVADVPALAGLTLTNTQLDDMPVIGLRESPHYGLNIVVKRVMDAILAVVAIVLFAPLMLVIAVAVRISGGPGPILYRQERCSLNGRKFLMLKFRTLREDAEAETGPVWAQENDPRRTRIGAFLRRSSLDELPQFFNVLWGDMSLVGPRPERPVFIDKFRHTIPNYMARLSVKSGITGWAQVHGYRGNTSLRKRLEYDLHYITHWNPWLDLRIMWMTLWHGLFHRNAY